VLIGLWLVCAIACAALAPSRGRSAVAWFFIGLLTSLLGLLILAALPTIAPPLPAGETKTCPDCAEIVLRRALVCRYCGHRFDPESAAAPAAGRTLIRAPSTTGRAVATVVALLLGLFIVYYFAPSRQTRHPASQPALTGATSPSAAAPDRQTQAAPPTPAPAPRKPSAPRIVPAPDVHRGGLY
jgi:hypothetical protein